MTDTDLWSFDVRKPKDFVMAQPQFKEGQEVTWVTKTWGRIPGVIRVAYVPEGSDGLDTRYTVRLDVKDCPQDFLPECLVFARGDTLRARRPKPAPEKRTKAKKTTGRVYKDKAVGRAKVIPADNAPLFVSPED